MPWKPQQFRAIMANTKDPKKKKEYAEHQKGYKTSGKASKPTKK